MKAIIIDDEKHGHSVLVNLLVKNHKYIQIVGNAYTVSEGYNMIKQLEPDLVFLDVEMPDGLGIDLLKKITPLNFNVIFTTGHSHYAHAAIRNGAIDYLLKPILEEELLEAINRVKSKRLGKTAESQVQFLTESLSNMQRKQLPTRLSISTSEGIIFIEIKNIIRLEAKQNYTEFTFVNSQKKILASINLGEYEDRLKTYSEFMRVHRSHLVNLKFVEKYVKGDGGYLDIKGGDKITISRKYKDLIINQLRML